MNSSKLSAFLQICVCIAGPGLVTLVPMAAVPAIGPLSELFKDASDPTFMAKILITLPAIMLIASAPLAGAAANRVGRKNVLLVSLILYVIGGAGILLTQNVTAIFAMRALLGIASGAILTTCLALIGQLFHSSLREKVLGYATAFSSLVAAFALIYGGRLVDAGGWHASFSLHLSALPVFFIAAFCLPTYNAERSFISNQQTNQQTKEPTKQTSGTAAALRSVWGYLLLLSCLAICMFTPSFQVGLYLKNLGMESAEMQGQIIGATSVVAIFSAAFFGWGRKFLSVEGFLMINALTMGSGIIIIGLFPSTSAIFIGCLLIGVGAGMSEPAVASKIFDEISVSAHAVAMGVIVSALFLGQFLNPFVFKLLSPMGAGNDFIFFGLLVVGIGIYIGIKHGRSMRAAPKPQQGHHNE